MTVAATPRIAGPYQCTGGETLLSYGFRILSEGDLAVWRQRGVGQERLTLGVHYTVIGVGNAGGGTVTLLSAALAGDEYVIEGDRPQRRTSDLVYNKAMPPVTVNGELDSLQIQIREIADRVSRAVARSRFVVSAEGLDLPEEAGFLKINADGGLVTVPDGAGGGGGGLPELPLTVENGGTGADDPAEARDNLGLAALATKDQVAFGDISPGLVRFVAETRTLSSPPATPEIGQAWLMGDGPLSGAWSTFDAGIDIAVWTGSAWARHQPSTGWTIEIADEDRFGHFSDGAWHVFLHTSDVGVASVRRSADLSHFQFSGVSGGVAQSSGWYAYPLNTIDRTTIAGLTLDVPTSRMSIPRGDYRLRATVQHYQAYPFRLRLRNITTGVATYGPISYAPSFATTPAVAQGGIAVLSAPVSVTADTEQYVLEYFCTSSGGGGNGLGQPQSLPSVLERYGIVELEDQAAQQGVTTVPKLSSLDALPLLDDNADYLIGSDTSADQPIKVLGKNIGYTAPISGAVTRGLQDKLRDVVSLDDFAIPADGTSVTTALQLALNVFAAAGGGRCLVPASKQYRVGDVTIPTGVTLAGSITALDATTDNLNWSFSTMGSTLLIESGKTISVSTGAALTGCIVRPFGMDITAQTSSAAWAGNGVTCIGHGATVANNIILGFNRGIYSVNWSRLRIEWNVIDANSGIDIVGTFDSTRILNNHCWPYLTHKAFWTSGVDWPSRDKTKLYRTGQGLYLSNGSDDTHVDGNLFYGHLVGIRAFSANGLNLGRNWVDHPFGMNRSGNIGLLLEGGVDNASVQTTFVWGAKVGVQIALTDATSSAQLDLVHCEVIDTDAVIISGGDVAFGRLEAQSCGGRAVNILDPASRVTLDRWAFKSIAATEPIALPAGATTETLALGDGTTDDAAGTPLIGNNPRSLVSIASASAINLPASGDVFNITGSTTIVTIYGGWGGRRVLLRFAAACQVAVSGGNVALDNLFSSGGAGGALELYYDPDTSIWREISRNTNGNREHSAVLFRDAASNIDGHLTRIAGDGSGNFHYQINTAAGGNFATALTPYTVAHTGDIGINNVSPLYQLDVIGDVLLSGTMAGTSTSSFFPQNFVNVTDTLNASGAGSYGDHAVGIAVLHTMAAGVGRGNRIAGLFELVKAASTGAGSTGTHDFYHGFFGKMYVTAAGANDGGTLASPKGNYFGGAVGVFIENPASLVYLNAAQGLEVDVSVPANVRLKEKYGIQIVYSNDDMVQATDTDAAIAIVADGLAAHPGGLYGLLFGKKNTRWPIDPITGVLIGIDQSGTMAGTVQAKYALDLLGLSIAPGGQLIRSNGWTVSGTGAHSMSAALIGFNGLGLWDVDTSNALIVTPATNLTGNRTLSLLTGDLDQVLDIASLNGDWTLQSPAPTVTATTGTYTTASATLYYRKIGKTVECALTVTIANNGTAATATLVALPWTAKGGQSFGGCEAGVTAWSLNAVIGDGSSSLAIRKYDGTYAGATGRSFFLSFTMRVN